MGTASYAATPLSAAALALVTPALLQVNASRIPRARMTPTVFAGEADTIVTTDMFAFDDSTDHYRLQGLGQACELGDAMVAQALSAFPGIDFHTIRNASDPQIANPSGNIETAAKQAASIYARYGGLTTAGSVIASWVAIQAA